MEKGTLSMDRVILDKIIKIAPGTRARFDGERCVSLSLTDPLSIFWGTARHLNTKQKKEILLLTGQLQKLKSLDLRKNRFGPIDKLELPELQHLELSSNYMGEIPEWIKNLRLESLGLGVNELKRVPDWMGSMKELRCLKIHKNELTSAEPIQNCKKLEELNLYQNRLKQIPEWVWNFEAMKHFSWGVSGITTVSESIEKWKNLVWLSLVANRIERLPETFCNLTQLKGARLHKNCIKELPQRIGDLKNLRELTLYRNRLVSLPDSFFNLKLRKLNLTRNEFESRPLAKAEWFCYEESDCIWGK
jgi:Leucine-rich repeat (LRR) protein